MTPRFRAWHKKEKKMFFEVEIRSFPKTTLITVFDSSIYGANPLTKRSPFILMQSTGLKDKNGKKIFEGDIVRNESWKSSHNYDTWHIESIAEFAHLTREYTIIANKDLEVIGNIHENPELLERKR